MAMGSSEQQVGAIFDGGSTLGLGSAGLLERFAARREPATFEAIVAHHGPMVLATCRRVLSNATDADDAFQATFLVLARQATAIRNPDRLAPWLHQVAHRVALRARTQSARRRRVEGAGQGEVAVAPAPSDPELRAVLDEELARLPAKYRDPLVLCYLEGLTHDEAASQLHWPVGTVRSRLAGGRDRLRSRLARRGFAPGAMAVLSPASLPVSAVSRSLLVATVRLVCTSGSGKAATSAALLAQGVLLSMFYAQVQTVALATLAVAATLATGTMAVVAQTPTTTAVPAPMPPAPPAAATPRDADPAIIGSTDKAGQLEATQAQIIALEAEQAKLRSYRSTLQAAVPPTPVPPTPPEPPTGSQTVASTVTKVDSIEVASSGQPVPPTPPTPPVPPMTDAQKAAYFGPWTLPLAGGKVLYLPAERDRVTVIDSALGKSFTYKDPGNITKIVPIFSETMGALMLEGPKVTEAVVLNTGINSWVRQPLRQPVLNGRITPVINDSLAYYVVGQSIYALSSRVMRWDVLDLKEPLADGKLPKDAVLSRDSLIVPEGETLHVFNFGTSRWAHVSTRDEEGSAQTAERPAMPAASAARPASPQSYILPGGKNLIVPPEQDRVVIGDQVFRPAGEVKRIVPIVGGSVVGLMLQGPLVKQVAAYNNRTEEWWTSDLRVPIIDRQVSPVVGSSSVEYRIGQLIYHYDTQSNAWTITDLDNLPR